MRSRRELLFRRVKMKLEEHCRRRGGGMTVKQLLLEAVRRCVATTPGLAKELADAKAARVQRQKSATVTLQKAKGKLAVGVKPGRGKEAGKEERPQSPRTNLLDAKAPKTSAGKALEPDSLPSVATSKDNSVSPLKTKTFRKVSLETLKQPEKTALSIKDVSPTQEQIGVKSLKTKSAEKKNQQKAGATQKTVKGGSEKKVSTLLTSQVKPKVVTVETKKTVLPGSPKPSKGVRTALKDKVTSPGTPRATLSHDAPSISITPPQNSSNSPPATARNTTVKKPVAAMPTKKDTAKGKVSIPSKSAKSSPRKESSPASKQSSANLLDKIGPKKIQLPKKKT